MTIKSSRVKMAVGCGIVSCGFKNDCDNDDLNGHDDNGNDDKDNDPGCGGSSRTCGEPRSRIQAQ